MNKRLPTTAASIFTLALASPALGQTPYPGFERDMALAFDNAGEPMELALLSEKEMAETKGAVWPFKIAWIGRLFWGINYGHLMNGYNIYERNGYSDHRSFYQWAGLQTISYGVVGLLSVNHAVAVGLGFINGVSLNEFRQVLWRNNWSVLDAVRHANSALERQISGIVGGGGGASGGGGAGASGAETMSARPTRPDPNRFLVGLLKKFDQDKLRQFLSDIPDRAFSSVLSKVAPEVTRKAFLDDLPIEIVNEFLVAMPEKHMGDFKKIIPSNIMNRISTSSAMAYRAHNRGSSSVGHWRY